MSGTRPLPPTPAEHHLGDRLAALVDGELGHDSRERVLAHLATCGRCKAEADAQRTLKSVFASAAPPPPSEGFLARLQGLPGGPDEPGGPGEDPGRGRKSPLEELFGAGGPASDGFATAAVGAPRSGGPDAGFRIHEVGDRPAGAGGRGRRFAFAAASAVSFAAIALGGALPLDASVSASGRGQGTGSAVTPLRAGVAGGSGGAGTSSATRGTRSGERTGDRSVPAEPLVAVAPATGRGTVPAVPLVAAGRSLTTPLVAVGLSYPPSHSLLPLSPFVRPAAPAPRPTPPWASGPAASPTTTPLGSPR